MPSPTSSLLLRAMRPLFAPKSRAAMAALVLACTVGPALAKTVVSNGAEYTDSGSYEIPGEVKGAVTITATGGGGGGGGQAGTSENGGGNGGNGARVDYVASDISGMVFDVEIGSGGKAGLQGYVNGGPSFCGSDGTDGGKTTVRQPSANNKELIWAVGGRKGTGACTSGGSTTAGISGSNGNPSLPDSVGDNPRIGANAGGGGLSKPYPLENLSHPALPGGSGSVRVTWTMQNQTLSCPTPGILKTLNTPVTLQATVSPARADLEYTSQNTDTCTISGNQLTPKSWGICAYEVKAPSNAGLNVATKLCFAQVNPDFQIVGTVTGLSGTGATASIRNNYGTPTQVPAGGSYRFLANQGESYSITATAPGHLCTVANGSGTMSMQPQTSVTADVSCVPSAYDLSGTVSGSAGDVKLKVNTQEFTLNHGNGPFTLRSTLQQGQTYPLTISSAPAGQNCAVTPASTGVVNGPVSGVQVNCGYPLAVNVTGLNEGRTLELKDNNANLVSTRINGLVAIPNSRAQPGDTYTVSITQQPEGQTCTVGDAQTGATGVAGMNTVVPVFCTTTSGGTDTFAFNGQWSTWTVPPGVTKVAIEVAGGGGGGGMGGSKPNGIFPLSVPGGDGSNGVLIKVANYTVTPGQVFRFRVGLGGDGGVALSNADGGGGGSTGLYLASAPNEPLVIAAGAQGGGGISGSGADTVPGAKGNSSCARVLTTSGTPEGGLGYPFAMGGGGFNGLASTSSAVYGGGGGGGATPTAVGSTASSFYPTTGATCDLTGGALGKGSLGNGFMSTGGVQGARGNAGWVKFTTSLVVANQSITCGSTANKTFGDANFDFPTATVSATGGTAGALSYGNVGDQCVTAAGNQLSISGAGICSYDVTAAASGNIAATTQRCVVSVDKAITAIALPFTNTTVMVGSLTPFLPTYTPAQLANEIPTLASNNTPVCTIDSSGISGVSPGTCRITAERPGNANYNGASSFANITVVAVPIYTIAGSVNGLVNGQIASISVNNGTATPGNSFSFSATQNSSYQVHATAPHHTCTTLTGVATAGVSNLAIQCTPVDYTVSGTVTGLTGTGATAKVTNNGAGVQNVINNGSFQFSMAYHSSYALAVTADGHACTVGGAGSGTADGVVSNVAITCQINSYAISARVTGLAANATLVLRNNGGDDLSITANGDSVFATKVRHNERYDVSVQTQPTGQTCTVAHGSGTATAAVSDVTVTCDAQSHTITGTIAGLKNGAQVQLLNNGSGGQTLGNGAFSFTATHGSAYALSTTNTAEFSCTVSATGTGSSITADVTGVEVSCTTTTHTLQGSALPALGGKVNCSAASVDHGKNATCTAQAETGWRFKAFDANSSCTRTSGAQSNVCELDNVQANATVTAEFEPWIAGTTVPATGTGGAASATFTGGGATCRFESAGFVAAPSTLPAGSALPQGMFQFKLVGCDKGSTVRVSVTWPQAMKGVTKYSTLTKRYFAPDNAVASGQVTSFDVTDGATGDEDGVANGEIVDPVAGTTDASTPPVVTPGVNATPVPTLSEWALIAMSLLMAGFGVRMVRRRTA